jgi:hypothetical protein
LTNETYHVCAADSGSLAVGITTVFVLFLPNGKRNGMTNGKAIILLQKDYFKTQILGNKGNNFKALHFMIHQVKYWIGTSNSWVSKDHIAGFVDELYHLINHSKSKNFVFRNPIQRMIKFNSISDIELCG